MWPPPTVSFEANDAAVHTTAGNFVVFVGGGKLKKTAVLFVGAK